MNKKTKLKLCLFANCMLLFIITGLMITFSDGDKYCRFGPQKNLIILSLKIDTWDKYYTMLMVIAFIKMTKVLIQKLAMPVLNFSIYNPDKTVITEFTKNELQFFANSMYLISSLRSVCELIVTISQLDLALYSVIVSEIASFIGIRILLNEKKFVKKTSKFFNIDELNNIV